MHALSLILLSITHKKWSSSTGVSLSRKSYGGRYDPYLKTLFFSKCRGFERHYSISPSKYKSTILWSFWKRRHWDCSGKRFSLWFSSSDMGRLHTSYEKLFGTNRGESNFFKVNQVNKRSKVNKKVKFKRFPKNCEIIGQNKALCKIVTEKKFWGHLGQLGSKIDHFQNEVLFLKLGNFK